MAEVILCKFTFHYVSIKSDKVVHTSDKANANLHSTMYLLNQKSGALTDMAGLNLHSTMYLLNPG